MTSVEGTISEADILADVIRPDGPGLSPDAARDMLQWKFSDTAVAHMNDLSDRNDKGTITEAERDDLHKYLRVGNLINLLQAKARLALKQADGDSA